MKIDMETEDYVSFEVAKELKAKGFDEPCNCWYGIRGTKFSSHNKSNYNSSFHHKYSRPTLYHTQKWLRKKYNIHIDINPIKIYNKIEWYYSIIKDIFDDNIITYMPEENFVSYEAALNKGILESLKFNKVKIL